MKDHEGFGGGPIVGHGGTTARTRACVARGAAVVIGAALATLPIALPLHAQAARQDAWVIRMGADTFAVENVTRAADRLDGELTGRAVGRLVYSAALGPAGTTRDLTLRAWPAGAPVDAQPTQQATITVTGESATAEITTAAGTQTQPLATRADAMIYVNPSFALMEQVIIRARALGGERVEVPVLMAQGGQTLTATITWPEAEAAAVELAGSTMRVVLDAAGEVTGFAVPAQNLTVTRVRGAHVRAITLAPPDYSAPADAPYRAEEVRVPTPDGHVLAGTLTRPAGAGRVPAVVTITGSGAQDRDQSIPVVPGYRPFREVADTLSRRGIAVLRLDDRGFGASGGDFATATSADFATDIAAAVAWLRSREDIDGARIALVGHSEGGLIAPIVASTDTALAGIVLIAGPAQSGREIIEYQQRYVIENAPTIPVASRDSALAAARAELERQTASQPWLRYFLDHDPLAVAHQVRRTPVLILHGETDRQVTIEQAEALGAAFRRAGNRDVEVRTFPDVNHLLLADPDGAPAGYATLPDSRVFRPLLGALADWLHERLH